VVCGSFGNWISGRYRDLLHALDNSFDYLIVLYGDDQGDLADILPYLRDGSYRDADALLGARFMKGSRLVGYSAVRTLGNRCSMRSTSPRRESASTTCISSHPL